MKRLDKSALLLAFAATIVFTGYGILQLSSKGGPCNAGLAIIALAPPFLICIILLVAAFSWLNFTSKTTFGEPIALAISSLLIWIGVSAFLCPTVLKRHFCIWDYSEFLTRWYYYSLLDRQ